MKKALVAMFCFLFFLTGCGENQQEASVPSMNHMSGHESETTNAAVAESQKKYKLAATLQEEGDLVRILIDTDLTFSTEHYGQAHQYGEGHIHFYMNDILKGPIMQNGPFQIDQKLLKDGANRIRVTLAGNDHSEPYNATVELEISQSKNE